MSAAVVMQRAIPFLVEQVIEYTDPAGETREIEVPDIENLYGSYEHDDILVGAHSSNRLIGFKGDDETGWQGRP